MEGRSARDGERWWGWVDPKTWNARRSISCSQAAALMINGAVENSSLGVFFSLN